MQQLIPDTQFHIQDIVYYPVKQHQPMLMRPYAFSAPHEAVETLSNKIAEVGAGSITPNLVSPLAGQLLQPSAVGMESHIDQSWVNDRRFVFMMRVQSVDHMGFETNTYLFGYTNHDGITPSGLVDDRMIHYVNNVIETAASVVNTPTGMVRIEKLHRVYNTIYSHQSFDMYTQRPSDLYQLVQNIPMSEMMLETNMHLQNAHATITPYSNNVIASTAENSIGTQYLASALTAGVHCVKDRSVTIGGYEITNNDPASKFHQDPSVSECAFLKYLYRLSRSRNLAPVFAFGTLTQVQPNAREIAKLIYPTREHSGHVELNTPEVGEYWTGQDMTTVKAYALLESCTALASKYGFVKFSFSASNMVDVTGQIHTTLLGMNSFLRLQQQDMSYLVDVFFRNFIDQIFIAETYSGRHSLHMECHINLAGTSKIYLEFAGFHGKWYTAPTFANSTYSPVITRDLAHVTYGAEQLNAMVEYLAGSTPQQFY